MPTLPDNSRLPAWFRVPYRGGEARREVRGLLRSLQLHTVCEQARCPNLCDCWSRRTATFLILGDRCTRDCRFCAVAHGAPPPPDPAEPERIAEAVARLELRFVVLTSVTRDDLPDAGAGHFAACLQALRARLPDVGIEVLTPDFGGSEAAIAAVLAAAPDVFNHNLETCARLTPQIRSGAAYRRSLDVLATARRLAATRPQPRPVRTKSGFMLGLGETAAEVRQMLADLRAAGVELLVIGQYLPPTPAHWPLARHATPAEFEAWARVAREEFGFAGVVSHPLARSSYHAAEVRAAAAAAPSQP
ncbi:MAG: lipoyl synthase [Lentisphaeria bacterium]|jgi:lipoic acid synthetase